MPRESHLESICFRISTTQRLPLTLARLPDAGCNRVGLVVNFSHLPEWQAVHIPTLCDRSNASLVKHHERLCFMPQIRYICVFTCAFAVHGIFSQHVIANVG